MAQFLLPAQCLTLTKKKKIRQLVARFFCLAEIRLFIDE